MTLQAAARTRQLTLCALAAFVIGCAPGTPVQQASPTPSMTCSASCITEFATAASAAAPPQSNGTPLPGTPLDLVTGIATGADGAVWFFEVNTSKLGRLAADGTLSEFLIPGAPSLQGFVAVAKDGSVWVTGDRAGPLTRRSTDGTFTQFPLGLAPNQILRSVLVGPMARSGTSPAERTSSVASRAPARSTSSRSCRRRRRAYRGPRHRASAPA